VSHEFGKIRYAGMQGSFATLGCECGWTSPSVTLDEPLWLQVLMAEHHAHAEDAAAERWLCTWEKVRRTIDGGAELADCREPAIEDSEPPRCYQHWGRP